MQERQLVLSSTVSDSWACGASPCVAVFTKKWEDFFLCEMFSIIGNLIFHHPYNRTSVRSVLFHAIKSLDIIILTDFNC